MEVLGPKQVKLHNGPDVAGENHLTLKVDKNLKINLNNSKKHKETAKTEKSPAKEIEPPENFENYDADYKVSETNEEELELEADFYRTSNFYANLQDFIEKSEDSVKDLNQKDLERNLKKLSVKYTNQAIDQIFKTKNVTESLEMALSILKFSSKLINRINRKRDETTAAPKTERLDTLRQSDQQNPLLPPPLAPPAQINVHIQNVLPGPSQPSPDDQKLKLLLQKLSSYVDMKKNLMNFK